MTLQSRFHFLNLWDETPDQGEGRDEEEKEGSVRQQQSANMGTSQWANEHSVPGKCSFVCVLTLYFPLNLFSFCLSSPSSLKVSVMCS